MSRKLSRRALSATIMLVIGGGAAFVASPALAAHSTVTGTCQGFDQPFTVTPPANHSSANGGWGTAQVFSGPAGIGALTPNSLNVVVVDTRTGETVFAPPTSMKGQGNANQNQGTLTCSANQTGTVADLVPPALIPPGTANDPATSTLTVTFVPTP